MSRIRPGSRSRLLLLLVLQACSAADVIENARVEVRNKRLSAAVAQLEPVARAGSADASYLLGLACWGGSGVAPDRARARTLLQSAASSGHTPAAHALAALLAQGDAAERAQSRDWLARAAQAGYTPAVAQASAQGLPLADARFRTQAADEEVRFDIAMAAVAADDVALLDALGPGRLAQRRGEFGRTLLRAAADSDATGALQRLLSAGADPNAVDDFGVSPLMSAVHSKDPAAARLLLQAGARPEQVNNAGRTALFFAAEANRKEAVVLLLERGVSANHADANGWTALDVAVGANAEDARDALRAAGARGSGVVATRAVARLDPSRPGELYRGWPPVAIAAVRDDVDALRRFARTGANLDELTPDGETALQVAIAARADDAVRELIQLGASLGRGRGADALQRLVRRGSPAVLESLVLTRMKLDTDPRGPELLATAVRRGDAAMVRVLLAAGLSPSAPDKRRTTPLMIAARLDDADMVKLLLDRGAKPGDADSDGRTALWHAASADATAAVIVLAAVDPAANRADRDGTTPLLAGIRSRASGAVGQLLASRDALDAQGGREPPLIAAASADDLGLLRQVLAKKPRLDETNAFGDTALMIAAKAGNAAICDALLAAGANSRLRNRERATAAELAEARGFGALARRLRD